MYTPLHVHTDASLDGAGTVVSLVKEAARLHMSALAMTDHGTLANAVAFWSACTEHDIKPILGLEAYLLYHGVRHHITLHAMNEEGFGNLVKLNTWSHVVNHSGGYPLVTLDALEKHREGLHALTGCASSALHAEYGRDYFLDLCDAMDGPRNVGAEVMFVGTHDIWSKPIEMAKGTDVKIVVTNDTHYPCRDQFHAHQAITKSRRGFTYDSQHLWLKSYDELMHEAFKFTDPDVVTWGLYNTNLIAERVEAWDMKRKPSLPHIPNVNETLTVALKDALRKDIAAKGGSGHRIGRLKYEFHILNEKDFLAYIYILWDIVKWAKDNNVYVGPGRGSGGGSYLLYLLGITGIDPLEHNLLFERFLNPARMDYPDIDVDFEADRREMVLNYAQEKWGTVPIATYSCYSHKSAVHDIARVLTIPKSLEIEAADSTADSEVFEKFINAHPDALSTYNTMMGQIRHRGKHAAGVIVTDRPIPIERAGDQLVAAWAEGMNTKDLSKVGIVKYDLLSLSALSQLHWLEERTGDACPHYDDPQVYRLFCEGDVAGIFQWTGSDGIRDLTMRVAPRNFNDLATINALYRPGALDAGTATMYPEFMKNPRKLHPKLDHLLEDTYGVICFQEQVMAVYAEVTGTTFGEADLARRLLSKAAVGDPKWEAEMNELRSKFFWKGVESFYDEEFLTELWHEIYTHSRYSFNKSHAFAYTMISYQLAYFKAYYRPEFTVAMLRYDKGNAQTYIMDAVQNGLYINMPAINISSEEYELSGDTIYLPLSDVAFLGEEAVKTIVEERRSNGHFLSYEEFDKRVPKKKCNSRAKTQLERIGAFKTLTGDPKSMMPKYDEIPVEHSFAVQLDVLGYVVPTQSLIRVMEKLLAVPCKKEYERFAGFVTEMVDKKSAKGEYRVYHLSPHGSFWCRPASSVIGVGSFVSGSKSFYGSTNDVKVYRLKDAEE